MSQSAAQSGLFARLAGIDFSRPTRVFVIAGLVCAVVGQITQPQTILASFTPPLPYSQELDRERLTHRLGSVLAGSHRVLALHSRQGGRFTDILLWIGDERHPGVVDPDEIVLLSHSPILRSLTWYELEPSSNGRKRTWAELSHTFTIVDGRPVDLARSRFADQWRTSLDVKPRIIASGLSDMLVHLSEDGGAERRRVLIDLIWRSDSSDGPRWTSTAATVHVVSAPEWRSDR